MTTDPFTEAAHRDRDPSVAGENNRAWFVAGAVWQAAQEPTDAEVEAAARAIHEHFPRKYVDEFGFTCTARWEDLEPHMQDEYRVVARAALSAARAARRDEEKR